MRASRGTSFTNGITLSGGPFSDAVFNLSMVKAAFGLRRDASIDIADANYTNYVEFSW